MLDTRVEETRPPESCSDYEWRLGPYLDGELPRGELAALEEHLHSCNGCRCLVEQFRNLDQLARTNVAATPSLTAAEWGGVWAGIRDQAAARSGPAQVRRLRDWLIPLLSAAALLALGLWLGYSLLQTPPDRSDVEVIHHESSEEAIPVVDIDDEVDVIDYLPEGASG